MTESTPQQPGGTSQWMPPGPDAAPTTPPSGAPTTPPPGVAPGSPSSTAVMPPPPPGFAPPPKKKDRRGSLAAAALVGALVLGGGAGFGGAALFYSTQNDGARGGGAAATGSQVVNSKAPAGTSEKVAAKVLPSVVKIEVSGQGGSGSGSGIILSSDGLILTNNHVVDMSSASESGGQPGFPGSPGQEQPQQDQQASSITVDFNDGTKAKAKVVGNDPLTDTAVIQAEGVSGLTPATIGKSNKLVVGQDVVAIGSPYGLDSTVTTGIVSALDRPVNVGSDSSGNATVYPAIQTDAAINPGNSGGALVDMNGNVVGINASIRSNSSSGEEAGSIGLGFAIPIDEVLPIIDQLKAGDGPTHARMGISVGDSSAGGSDQTSVTGATVQDVTGGSAAEKAGLEKGDTVTKVGQHQISGSDSLVATVRSYRPGDDVEVTWSRDGKEHSAKITLDSDAS